MSLYVVKEPKQSGTYNPGKQLDWEITYSGYEFVPNSFYISGDLTVLQDGAQVLDSQDVKWDGKSGIHNVFQSWSVTFQRKGEIENLTGQYPRFVRMMTDCQLDKNDLCDSKYSMELRTSNDQLSRTVLRGEGVGNQEKPARFFFKPLISINRSSGAPITESQFGVMRLHTRLGSVQEVLYGEDVIATTSYNLTNVRLHYKIRPQGQYSFPTVMKSYSVIPKLIEATNSTLQVQNPVISNSVSISFLKTNHEMRYKYNNSATETLPNLQRLEFIMNDQTNSYLSFPLTNISEILNNGVLSFGAGVHNEVNANNVERGNCCVAGLRFPKTMNFLNSNMTVNIQSNANNEDRYNIYLFFHTDLVV